MKKHMPTNYITNEMDKVLGRHKLPESTKEETESLERPITSKEIGLVI